MTTRRNVQYSRLGVDDDDYVGGDERHDPRFDYSPGAFDRIPWKSIALALFMLFLGRGLLLLAFFVFTGHMGGEKSQAYGLFGLGILTFLLMHSMRQVSLTFFLFIALVTAASVLRVGSYPTMWHDVNS